MNISYTILNRLVGNEVVEPLELSGAKFKSIEGARAVAKKCQKSKHKLIPVERVAKVLGVEKVFYSMIKENHVLIIIDGEEASIELIPDGNNVLYNCYQVVSDAWRWWSMGANLSIMVESLQKLGAKKFDFNQDFVIGIQDEETIYCLTSETYPYDKLERFLPPIPPKKVVTVSPLITKKLIEIDNVPTAEEKTAPKLRKKK